MFLRGLHLVAYGSSSPRPFLSDDEEGGHLKGTSKSGRRTKEPCGQQGEYNGFSSEFPLRLGLADEVPQRVELSESVVGTLETSEKSRKRKRKARTSALAFATLLSAKEDQSNLANKGVAKTDLRSTVLRHSNHPHYFAIPPFVFTAPPTEVFIFLLNFSLINFSFNSPLLFFSSSSTASFLFSNNFALRSISFED